jgi:hypothetical protein
LQNDDHLLFAMTANTAYVFEVFLAVDATADGSDILIDFAAPGGATIRWGGIGLPLNVTAQTNQNTNVTTASGGDDLSFGVPDESTSIFLRGTVVNGGTAGNLQLRWALQDDSGTQTVTVLANSHLVAHPLP